MEYHIIENIHVWDEIPINLKYPHLEWDIRYLYLAWERQWDIIAWI